MWGGAPGLTPERVAFGTRHFSEPFSNRSDGNKRIQRQLVALQREAVAGRVVPIAPPLLLQGFLAQDHVVGKGERGRAWDLGAGALGRPRRFPPLGPARSRGVGTPCPLFDR